MEDYPAFATSHATFEALVADLSDPDTLVLDHAALEGMIEERGREVLCQLMQDSLHVRAAQDRAETGPMRGSDGELRTEKRSSHRPLKTLFGPVTVTRLALMKHGVSGGLRPLDAWLNLPVGHHSLGVRERVAWGVANGSYEATVTDLRRTTGTTLGKRQAEELCLAAARDFFAYYEGQPAETASSDHLLVLSFDGKGVRMRPEGLRDATRKKAAQAAGTRAKQGRQRGPHDRAPRKKHSKRMAEVACVYDLEVQSRTPEEVMRELRRAGPHQVRPRPVNKRVWASLERSVGQVVDDGFHEALLRDEHRQRRWVTLVDAHQDQLAAVQTMAANVGVAVTIVIDLLHVLQYLWGAGRGLLGKDNREAVAEWVTERTERLLQGRARRVAAGMRQAATLAGLTGKRRENVDKCADYLLKYQAYLRYDEYLRDGLPIATGVIEGACRSLVQDRMGITGARWGLEGAEAVLKLRSLRASGDFDDYWRFHKRQELERNHLRNYDDGELLDLRKAA